MTRDPSLIGVLLGLPTFVFLVAVIAVTVDRTPLRRFAYWLVYTAGGW